MNTAQQPLFTVTPYGFRADTATHDRDTTHDRDYDNNESDIPSLSAVTLPDDHPIRDLYTAPDGYGPGLYPGFRAMAHMLEQAKRDEAIRQMTPAQIAAVWNRLAADGGSVIHWDQESGQYMTRDCEAFSVDDVEATVRGLLEY